MNGLIACLFYVTSWEISIVYLLSCIWIWCLNLNMAPAAAARPGQAAAPGTLYNDVESPSSELVLVNFYFEGGRSSTTIPDRQ